MITWAEMFPAGRQIFYEGSDPWGFVAQIRERFGFDPAADPAWRFDDYCLSFVCPPEHLDVIYASGEWVLGS